jgi:3-oxoacyl-[acyl-carrier-protein] synthase II
MIKQKFNRNHLPIFVGDRVENDAIKSVFGEHSKYLSVSSSKGAIGHLLGAAGAVESIFTILAVHHVRNQVAGLSRLLSLTHLSPFQQKVPPTINLEAVEDPVVFDLDYVPHQGRSRSVKAALCNSFGFGGTHASLCFQKWEPQTTPSTES